MMHWVLLWWYTLLSLIGPTLCCCCLPGRWKIPTVPAASLAPVAPTALPANGTESPSPIAPPVCCCCAAASEWGDEFQASRVTASESAPTPQPLTPRCPCPKQALHLAARLTETERDLRSDEPSDWAISVFSSFRSASVVIDLPLPITASLRQLPFLTTSERLYAHHVLRC